MIIDLPRFLDEERPYWTELETLLDRLDRDPVRTLTLGQAKRFHYLYQRTASDLSKIATFTAEQGLHHYLETLAAKAYSEIHETRRRSTPLALANWFLRTFPRTFRRHANPFLLALAVTLAGAAFGAGALLLDPDAKEILIPFPHLAGDPAERVRTEETQTGEAIPEGRMAAFSARLMTHNTRVSIGALALGMTFGLGTLILLLGNGIILGAVICDYVLAGETAFLIGWLLPHGAIEIPAILLAGQGGLILGRALMGWGTPHALRTRLRHVTADLTTLIFGVAILLIWAGLIEAFFSQYHEPLLPYPLKIAFGLAELALLILFLTRAGVESPETP